jgi:homoserine O-acetyltransferase
LTRCGGLGCSWISEFRIIEDIAGHLGLFATVPTYMPQIDQHLGDLLSTQV